MEQLPEIYLSNREDWRDWLAENHAVSPGVWLVYYKKHTGIERIAYDDAVEEALCFGWIDSTVRRLDDRRFCQKFVPRRKRSGWSAHNRAAGRKTDGRRGHDCRRDGKNRGRPRQRRMGQSAQGQGGPARSDRVEYALWPPMTGPPQPFADFRPRRPST